MKLKFGKKQKANKANLNVVSESSYLKDNFKIMNKPWGQVCHCDQSSRPWESSWSRQRPRVSWGWRAYRGRWTRTWRSSECPAWGARRRAAAACSGWCGCWACRSSSAAAATRTCPASGAASPTAPPRNCFLPGIKIKQCQARLWKFTVLTSIITVIIPEHLPSLSPSFPSFSSSP